MKKTLTIAFIAALTLVSCKKDYACSCTSTTHQPEFSSGGTVYQQESTTTSTSSTTIKDKKKDAKASCESKNGTSSVASPWAGAGAEPTTITVSCSISE